MRINNSCRPDQPVTRPSGVRPDHHAMATSAPCALWIGASTGKELRVGCGTRHRPMPRTRLPLPGRAGCAHAGGNRAHCASPASVPSRRVASIRAVVPPIACAPMQSSAIGPHTHSTNRSSRAGCWAIPRRIWRPPSVLLRLCRLLLHNFRPPLPAVTIYQDSELPAPTASERVNARLRGSATGNSRYSRNRPKRCFASGDNGGTRWGYAMGAERWPVALPLWKMPSRKLLRGRRGGRSERVTRA